MNLHSGNSSKFVQFMPGNIFTPGMYLLYSFVLQVTYQQFTAMIFNPKDVLLLVMVTDKLVLFFPLRIIGAIRD